MDTHHQDVVERAKAYCVAHGIDMLGPCGAFAIVKRAAWELRGEGAGLLDKPGGNQCQGFATDIICYRDGQAFDVLVGGGDPGGNGPAWNPSPAIDPGRWRAPIDPGDTPPVPDPPTPDPQPPPADHAVLVHAIAALDGKLDGFITQVTQGFTQMVDVAEDIRTVLVNLHGKPAPTYTSTTAINIGKKLTLKGK